MPRSLARALRAWLACVILALTCAPPALANTRAPVVMVAEAATEREESPCEQRQLERLQVAAPATGPSASSCAPQTGLCPPLQPAHQPRLYLQHCALLL